MKKSDKEKEFALKLLDEHKTLQTTGSSMFNLVQLEKPFETYEDARIALLIGDQEKRRDLSTYFTGTDEKTILGRRVKPPMGGWKAYEVEPFWIPVKNPSFPGGIRYYSFTKYPEIAVTADTEIALCGVFEPKKVRMGEYKDEWIRDPFVLLAQLNSGRRALSQPKT